MFINNLLFIYFLLIFNLILISGVSLPPSPPHIVKQPPSSEEILFQVKEYSFDHDKPFTIECEAEGNPRPEYYWLKDGKPFTWNTSDNHISQQSDSGTLIFNTPRNNDEGWYQCFAKNNFGIAMSNIISVRQTDLQTFAHETITVQAMAGAPFKLTCHSPDGYPKPKLNWFIQTDQGLYRSIHNPRITLDPNGNLWFAHVTLEDETKSFMYLCSASSLVSLQYTVGNKILMEVLSRPGVKPVIVPQYVSDTKTIAVKGKNIELYCIFGGMPTPTIQWFKGGKSIQSNDRVVFKNFGKTLLIQNVTFSDIGHYTCQASNDRARTQQHTIDLNVHAYPYFTREPQMITTAPNKTIEIYCKGDGEPEPQIKWFYNGKSIDDVSANERRTVKKNMIRIENVQVTDTGNYGCNITNYLGYVYKEGYVNVLELSDHLKPTEDTVGEPTDNPDTLQEENEIFN